MEECVLAFKFMSDLFQKSTVFTIMLFSFGNPHAYCSLPLSPLFCTGDIYSMLDCYVMNDPKAERIKTTNIYQFSASLGQEQLTWEIPPQGLLHQLGRQLSMELTGCEGSMFSWLTPVTLPGGLTSPPAIGRSLGLLPHGPLNSAS